MEEPERRGRARAGGDRAQRQGADQADRGPARRVADHHRQAAAERAADRARRRSSRAAVDAVRPAAEAKGIDARLRDRRDAATRSCRATRTACSRSSGTCSPTRSSSRRAAARVAVDADARPARRVRLRVTDTGAGHRRRVPAVRLRPLPPGRQLQHALARRAGHRADDRPPHRRAARRHGAGRQRRRGPRLDVHRDAADPASRPAGAAGRRPARRRRPAGARRPCSRRGAAGPGRGCRC